MSGFEYRVRWQREGRQATGVIYQSEQGARAKVDRLLALEEVKGDTRRFADMPDLVGTPTLEVREVGGWEMHAEAPPAEPSPATRIQMAEWTNDAEGVF